MKKITTIAMLCIGLIIGNQLAAQNCKYEKNEIDPVSKQPIKITKGVNLTGKLKLTENILVAKAAKTDITILILGLTIQSKTETELIAKKESKAWLITDDGDAIEISAIADFKGSKFSEKNLGNYQYGIDVQYELKPADVLKIVGKKVKMIRMEIETKGNVLKYDTELRDKNQDDIQELVKCVM